MTTTPVTATFHDDEPPRASAGSSTSRRRAPRAAAVPLDAFLGADAPPQEDYDAKFRDADRDDGQPAHDDGRW
jgi:hypothetical protein